MHSKTTYSYKNKKQIEYENSKIYFFEINNLLINNKTDIKKMHGSYFPIRYDINYSLLLWDYLGTYLKLKKIYKELKPIFFITDFHKYDFNKWSNVSKSVCDILNAEIIDITKESVIFEKIFLIEGDLPPIPQEIYSTKYWRYQELDDEVKRWWISNMKDVISAFPADLNISKQNTYITRSTMNKLYKDIKNDWDATRIQDTLYDESLDNKIKSIGFNVIETMNMSFLNQIKVGAQARVYSTIDGSGLINGLWAGSDTEVISFKVNQKYTDYGFYWQDFYSEFNKKINIISLENIPPENGKEIIVETLKKYV